MGIVASRSYDDDDGDDGDSDSDNECDKVMMSAVHTRWHAACQHRKKERERSHHESGSMEMNDNDGMIIGQTLPPYPPSSLTITSVIRLPLTPPFNDYPPSLNSQELTRAELSNICDPNTFTLDMCVLNNCADVQRTMQ